MQARRQAKRSIGVAALLLAIIFLPSAGAAFIEQQKLTTNDGIAFDKVGTAVAIDGNTAIVGAKFADVNGHLSSGAAYIFVRSAGVWTQQQKLTASDGLASDQFGYSVAIDGATAVVGAYFDEPPGAPANDNNGSAYVFQRSGAVWTQQQILRATDAAPGDNLGVSVGISGDTAIAGANNVEDSADVNENRGAAYVFTRAGVTWTQQQRLTPSDAAPNDQFGISVGINGDTAIAGAGQKGAAYVFTRTGGVWTEQQKVVGSTTGAGPADRYGDSVAVDGDTAIVGARTDDTTVFGDNQGAAFVFTRSGGVWTEQQRLSASDAQDNDNFGDSVGLSGDEVAVGAHLGGPSNAGAAYYFSRSGGVWTQQPRLIASDGVGGDFFGSSVDVSAGSVIAGAPEDTVGSETTEGSAYVYINPTTAVGVRALSVARTRAGIAVRWQTASEAGVLGYRVYRQRDGKRIAVSRLIPAHGAAAARSYTFLDRPGSSSKSLRYWLSIVRLDGSTTWAGSALLDG